MSKVVAAPKLDQPSGYEVSRFNSVKHGILSKFTILPWESHEEYDVLLTSLVEEHAPVGPTEEHLVEELTGIFWRMRRLRLAEAASLNEGLRCAIQPYANTAGAAMAHRGEGQDVDDVDFREALTASPERTAEALAMATEQIDEINKAIDELSDGDIMPDVVVRVLRDLDDEMREYWEEWRHENLEEDNSELLLTFLESEVRPFFKRRLCELRHRETIKTQAYGQALSPEALDKLARYETHLDRKLERTLTMLIRLQDIRQSRATVE